MTSGVQQHPPGRDIPLCHLPQQQPRVRKSLSWHTSKKRRLLPPQWDGKSPWYHPTSPLARAKGLSLPVTGERRARSSRPVLCRTACPSAACAPYTSRALSARGRKRHLLRTTFLSFHLCFYYSRPAPPCQAGMAFFLASGGLLPQSSSPWATSRKTWGRRLLAAGGGLLQHGDAPPGHAPLPEDAAVPKVQQLLAVSSTPVWAVPVLMPTVAPSGAAAWPVPSWAAVRKACCSARAVEGLHHLGLLGRGGGQGPQLPVWLTRPSSSWGAVYWPPLATALSMAHTCRGVAVSSPWPKEKLAKARALPRLWRVGSSPAAVHRPRPTPGRCQSPGYRP